MGAPTFQDSPEQTFEEATDEGPPPNNRRGARQVALQTLYWNASSPGDGDAALGELSQRSAFSPEVGAFAAELVHRSEAHNSELRELIAATATHWEADRIARIDSIILRLALAEILYFEDIPVRVSIDEAVELAKIYSTEQSYAFINGILDAVVRQKGLIV